VSRDRQIALVVGVLFLITFATSIPALWAFQPVLDDPAGYIAGSGSDNRIFFGALLEMFLIIANVGTAVVLFPVLKGQSETLSLGYVTRASLKSCFSASISRSWDSRRLQFSASRPSPKPERRSPAPGAGLRVDPCDRLASV
jgi:hypothetical protein